MTDKELFEKVEKEFLPEKSLRLERFNKTNFQKVLNEVKGPQAPQANVGGFLSRVAAAIPGTRGYRMRSAEARKQEALARQEEIKAQQAEKDLKFGKKHKIGNAIARKYYDANPLYATAYDLVQAGKPITPDQRRAYNVGNKEIKALQQGEEKQKGKDEAFTKLAQDLFKKFDVEAPLVASFLRKPENKNFKILFQKYILQDPPISETELNQLAGGLINLYFDKQSRPRNKESATKLINFLKKQKVKDNGLPLINAIGIKIDPKPGSKPKSGSKDPELTPKTVDEFIKFRASKEIPPISPEAYKKEMVRKAKKYVAGNTVLGVGANSKREYKIRNVDNLNGLITLYSLGDSKKRDIYKFANKLGDIVERGEEQPELGLENFAQIIKRYR